MHGLSDEPLTVDGIIGSRTRNAITTFQGNIATISPSERGVPKDGSLGPVTLGALERTIGDKNPFGRKSAPPLADKPQAAPESAPSAVAADGANGAQAPAAEVYEGTGGGPPSDGPDAVYELPPSPEMQAKVAEEVQQAPPSGEQKGAAQDLEAKMKARLESARGELGKIAEKEFFYAACAHEQLAARELLRHYRAQ